MSADPKRVEVVFAGAIELPPADRGAFLAAECGGDAILRDRVERMLAAHDAPARTRDHRPDGDAPDRDPDARDDAGAVLGGKYKLVEEIGEGGMGSVWMAQQTEPVRRFVGVKLIKAGMDSKAVLARFDAERQALALMDHPNIARVLDAGAAPDGRPYFVMELVKGVPITRFCDEKRLTPRERLGLFVPVCHAIQHAHQKGIIHRDIKPSNVLVALYDDRPVPKVIDFGVAKATGQQLTDKTLATGFGAVVGTPEYMSPEQASFNNLDIDTRSDVYALGVLLYELLAGSPPFSRQTLERGGLLEIFRVIREQEPPRPSTRVSTAAALPTLSASRSTEPKRLSALLRGELDWIVMKALEKDRNRRYETANGFAADVQRYLAGEPVQAVPPSAGYRVRKFVRKHRGPVAAAAVVFAALVVGIAGMTWGLISADRARREAEQAGANERHERTRAEAALKDADDQRARAERQSLGIALDLLDQIDDERRLLFMARLAGTVTADAADLRQHLTMRIVTEMQRDSDIAPDLEGVPGPVRTADVGLRVTPDGRHLVGEVGSGGVGVWEPVTHRRLAWLREGGEVVTGWDFGNPPDVAYTIDQDERVRVWAFPSGRLLLRTAAAAEVLPGRGHRVQVHKVWLTARHLLVGFGENDGYGYGGATLDVERAELWNVAEKRRVAAWGNQKGFLSAAAFSPDGEHLLAGHADGTIQLVRTSDGAVVKERREPDRVNSITYSPAGRWAVTAGADVRWWRADTWEQDGPAVACPSSGEAVAFLGEDAVALGGFRGKQYLISRGNPLPLELPAPGQGAVHRGNRLYGGRWVLDLETRQISRPPFGQRYHADSKAAADDGRWLALRTEVIDLAVQRRLVELPDPEGPGNISTQRPARMPGGGYALSWSGGAKLVYVPPPTLEVPPDVLQLWVQVHLRGELGPDDEIVRWPEVAWDRKRQELAARAVPARNYPFPGRIVGDRWYWLREEVASIPGRGEGNRLINTERLLPLLDRLVAVEPTAARHVMRAERLEALGRWEAAAEDYHAARRLNPDLRSVVSSRTWDWVAEPGQPPERYRAAVRLAETARREQPENWDAAETLGVAYYRTSRFRDAAAVLREATERNRREVLARQLVGRFLPPPLAAAHAMRNDHVSPTAVAFLAMAHSRLGEVEPARTRLAELRTILDDPAVAREARYQSCLQEATEVVEAKR